MGRSLAQIVSDAPECPSLRSLRAQPLNSASAREHSYHGKVVVKRESCRQGVHVDADGERHDEQVRQQRSARCAAAASAKARMSHLVDNGRF